MSGINHFFRGCQIWLFMKFLNGKGGATGWLAKLYVAIASFWPIRSYPKCHNGTRLSRRTAR